MDAIKVVGGLFRGGVGPPTTWTPRSPWSATTASLTPPAPHPTAPDPSASKPYEPSGRRSSKTAAPDSRRKKSSKRGDRVVQRWRYSFDGGKHVRGVDLFRVRDGKVAENSPTSKDDEVLMDTIDALLAGIEAGAGPPSIRRRRRPGRHRAGTGGSPPGERRRCGAELAGWYADPGRL